MMLPSRLCICWMWHTKNVLIYGFSCFLCWHSLGSYYYYPQTMLQKDMSLCAPIQDNQVILVHMPPCISPPAPWPLSSAKSYLPSGLHRVFHSFIIYFLCPTDFSLLWHLTKKKLFSLKVYFEWIILATVVDGLWAGLLHWQFPHSSSRLTFGYVHH